MSLNTTTTSIQIQKNNAPDFKKINFKCDDKLNPKLDQYELIKNHLNKYNTTAFIGTMGSGKTSLVINLVKLYKKTFHKIFVFMPKYSRDSLKENIFDHLPPEQIFEELTSETIDSVYFTCMELASKGQKFLIIYDDVQKSLKDPEILRRLKNMVANQRHLHIVNWIILQNWFSLDRSLREIINNIFLFKLGKIQQKKIFDEVFEDHKDKYDEINNIVYNEPYNFLFLNIGSQDIYKNFDQIII